MLNFGVLPFLLLGAVTSTFVEVPKLPNLQDIEILQPSNSTNPLPEGILYGDIPSFSCSMVPSKAQKGCEFINKLSVLYTKDDINKHLQNIYQMLKEVNPVIGIALSLAEVFIPGLPHPESQLD